MILGPEWIQWEANRKQRAKTYPSNGYPISHKKIWINHNLKKVGYKYLSLVGSNDHISLNKQILLEVAKFIAWRKAIVRYLLNSSTLLNKEDSILVATFCLTLASPRTTIIPNVPSIESSSSSDGLCSWQTRSLGWRRECAWSSSGLKSRDSRSSEYTRRREENSECNKRELHVCFLVLEFRFSLLEVELGFERS